MKTQTSRKNLIVIFILIGVALALLIVTIGIPFKPISTKEEEFEQQEKYKRNYAEGKIIVKLKTYQPDERAEYIRDLIGARAIRPLFPLKDRPNVIAASVGLHRIYIVEIDMDVLSAVEELKGNPYVEYVEPVYIAETQMVPNDPYYHSSGTFYPETDDLWGLKRIGCEGAWDKSQGEGVVVGLIESNNGIDYTHEDIEENIWINPGEVPEDFDVDRDGVISNQECISRLSDYNSDGEIDLEDIISNNSPCLGDIDGDGNPDDDSNEKIDDIIGWNFNDDNNNPMDSVAHGTHVAGIIAAVGNNQIGVIGVSPLAKVLCIYGGGWSDRLAEAIVYTVDAGAKILNLSWRLQEKECQVLQDAIRYAHLNDCVVVAAAGNDRDDPGEFCPANISEVITVGATMTDNISASFSSYGVKLDVAAPGVIILSSIPGNRYANKDGTSTAVPYVVGVAGLIKSMYPNYSNEQIRQILKLSSKDIDFPGWDFYTGYGLINASQSLDISYEPCEALILNPKTNTKHDGIITIEGIASGPTFEKYELFYHRTNMSDTAPWEQIGNAMDSPKRRGNLMNWDIAGLEDGEYTLRLVVTDSMGNTYEDRKEVIVDRAYFTSIYNGSFLRIGDNIVLRGNIEAPNHDLRHFSIEYSPVLGSQWYPTGIDGDQEIINDIIGTWDTNQMAIREAGYYHIGIRVDGRIDEEVRVYMDPQFKEGWPKVIEWLSGNPPHRVNINTSNLDRNKNKEIIFPINNKIYVYGHDGSFLQGWPVEMQGAQNCLDIVTGDLDGDGYQEVVAIPYGSNGRPLLYIYEHNGILKSGFPKELEGVGGEMNSPVLADVDLDGRLDVIFKGKEENGQCYLHLFNLDSISQGRELPGWPKIVEAGSIHCYLGQTPCVGKLDNDPELEIIFAIPLINNPRGNTIIHAYNVDGTEVNGWPRYFQDIIWALGTSPVIGDVNRDGKDEVFIGMYSKGYLLDNEGNVLWEIAQRGNDSVALADINNDNYLEIILDGYKTLVLDYLGNTSLDIPPMHTISPIVGDIDNDNLPDILTAKYNALVSSADDFRIFIEAWDNNGRRIIDPINSYYKVFDVGKQKNMQVIGYPLFISDLEKDGSLDLVFSGFENIDLKTNHSKESITIMVWDLWNSYDASTIEWPMYQHDPHRTGNYDPNQPPRLLLRQTDFEIEVGEELKFRVRAYDPDGDPLTFSLENGPNGATINPQTGNFSWRPDSNQAGDYSITIVVSDDRLEDRKIINVKVIDPRPNLRISQVQTIGGVLGQGYRGVLITINNNGGMDLRVNEGFSIGYNYTRRRGRGSYGSKKYIKHNGIPEGGSITVRIKMDWLQYPLRFYVDFYHKIDETNERDNEYGA